MNPTSKVFADFFKDETSLSVNAEILMDKMLEGHVCLSLSDEDIESIHKSKFVNNGSTKQPFVLCEGQLYLERYFNYETNILNSIHRLVKYNEQEISTLMTQLHQNKSFIKQLFNNQAQGIDWQMVAALNACLYNFAIITGGPGTGKTTTVSKLLSILLQINPELKITLAAPTGKAAMRMKESMSNAFQYLEISSDVKLILESIQSQTIHRLLGKKNDSPYFKHDAENQLNWDVIIVDEASMIDVPMMSKLLDATKSSTKIIFLGDKNQLASVEAGSIFNDLCEIQKQVNTFPEESIQFFNNFHDDVSSKLSANNVSDENHFFKGLLVELQQSRRFNSEEGIGYFSKSVIEGIMLNIDQWNLQAPHITKGISIVSYLADIKNDVLDYEHYIKEKDIKKALILSSKLRVLCAVREGNYGVKMCNTFIEETLKEAKLIQPKFGFYENQLIMITSNNYQLGLYNGDIGIVRLDAAGMLKVYFEDQSAEDGLKEVSTSYIKNYETAFAMTIHKSQGSEFDTAIVVMPDHPIPILTRELLYTGITRAKTLAKIVVTQSVLDFCIGKQVQRSSGIAKRILIWA